jgi:hypothetical protein
MATQGIISITKDGKTVYKCIAGCNGYNIKKATEKLTNAIKHHNKLPRISDIFYSLHNSGFACDDCLVVLGEGQHYSNIRDDNDDSWKPDDLYLSTFNDPKFNPRWECGLADHVHIIELNDIKIIPPPDNKERSVQPEEDMF